MSRFKFHSHDYGVAVQSKDTAAPCEMARFGKGRKVHNGLSQSSIGGLVAQSWKSVGGGAIVGQVRRSRNGWNVGDALAVSAIASRARRAIASRTSQATSPNNALRAC